MQRSKSWVPLVIPGLIALFLLLSSTTDLFRNLSLYDAKRIQELFLFFLVFLLAFCLPTIRNSLSQVIAVFPRKSLIGLSVFFLLGVLSSVVNADTLRGLLYSFWDVLTLGFVFLSAVVVATCRLAVGNTFDNVCIAALTLLGLGVGFQEFSGFWSAWLTGYEFSFDIALPYFYHPRNYNQLQTWSIPVITALPFLFPRNRLAAILCILTLGFHWFVLFETGARGSIVGLSVAFVFSGTLNVSIRGALLRWQLPGLLLGVVLYSVCLLIVTTSNSTIPTAETSHTTEQTPQSVEDLSTEERSADSIGLSSDDDAFYEKSLGRPLMHTSGRTWLWKSAIAYSQANPVWGIGPMNFSCDGPVHRVGSPHNLAFQVLSEWGIPATLILGGLAFWLLWSLIRVLRTYLAGECTVSALQLMLTVALVAAMVHLMVSSLLLTPASQVAAALICGWLLGLVAVRKSQTADQSESIGTRAVSKSGTPSANAALLLICMLLSGASAAAGVHELVHMKDYAQQRPDRDQMMSRFWQMGRVCNDSIKLKSTP